MIASRCVGFSRKQKTKNTMGQIVCSTDCQIAPARLPPDYDVCCCFVVVGSWVGMASVGMRVWDGSRQNGNVQ